MSMENNINIVQNKCTACRSCEQICPKNAITMIEDEEGFLYPKIDNNLCINCGLCIKKCHGLNKEYKSNYKNIYGIKPINKNISKKSTSGGFAYLLSKNVIENGGYVYGSLYNDDFYVKHTCVDNIDDLEKLRGSKYVASDTEYTFRDVKEKLSNGKEVLYIGTACQIAGLNSFLEKKYNNLLTVDIVCHGVPSNKLFKKYIQYLEKKYNQKVKLYEFRNKEKKDWGNGFCSKITFYDNSVKYLNADFDYYYSNFLQGNTYRESCYKCNYANINSRPADITIADCWGIEITHPDFYDKNGVSLVIVNTDIGKEKINILNESTNMIDLSEEEVVKYNLNLLKSTERTKIRDNIYKNIDLLEPAKFFSKNLKLNKSIKKIIKNILPNKLRMKLKQKIGE